jgi:AraC family transcriptional regulator
VAGHTAMLERNTRTQGSVVQQRSGQTRVLPLLAGEIDMRLPNVKPWDFLHSSMGSSDEIVEISSRGLQKSALHAVHVRRNRLGSTIVPTPEPNPTFMIAVHLRHMAGGYLWRDGRHIQAAPIRPQGIRIYDQRSSWVKDVSTPFESVNFFIPMSAFNELTDELKGPRIESLRFLNDEGDVDCVLEGLARALAPAIAGPSEMNTLFAEHLFAAVRLHVAQAYGGVRLSGGPRQSSLSPFQERRVKDRVLSDLAADVSLSELADICGLSRSYFIRAFKNTTGSPPHRWLILQRLQRAKLLLGQTNMEVSQIALSCGFADQSHLTRVFSKAIGTSPAAWRRSRS